MAKIDNFDIKRLSKHLFWDVDRDLVSFEEHKKLVIQRVLDYGLLEDWVIILNFYGIQQIAETAMTLRELDPKSISFISVLTDIPKENFLCYTMKQSMPQHWNF
jgi:hypothetical protein